MRFLSSFLRPRLHRWTINIVVVNLVFIAGTVQGIDVGALILPAYLGRRAFGMRVVAVNIDQEFAKIEVP